MPTFVREQTPLRSIPAFWEKRCLFSLSFAKPWPPVSLYFAGNCSAPCKASHWPLSMTVMGILLWQHAELRAPAGDGGGGGGGGGDQPRPPRTPPPTGRRPRLQKARRLRPGAPSPGLGFKSPLWWPNCGTQGDRVAFPGDEVAFSDEFGLDASASGESPRPKKRTPPAVPAKPKISIRHLQQAREGSNGPLS